MMNLGLTIGLQQKKGTFQNVFGVYPKLHFDQRTTNAYFKRVDKAMGKLTFWHLVPTSVTAIGTYFSLIFQNQNGKNSVI